MKCRFSHRRYRLPFRQPVRTAHGLWTEREGLLLRMETETGGIGFGEMASIPWFGTETVEEAEEVCRQLDGEISDDDRSAVPERCPCLRFAVSCAFEALQDKSEAEGGTADFLHKKALAVAALLPAGRPALVSVPRLAEAGFRTFKWKVGVGDLGDELALLDDLLAALPEGAKVRLDANGAWDRRQAERWLERCAERPIEFVEQPCFAGKDGDTSAQAKNDDLLLGLAADYPTPLALDESVVSAGDVEGWLHRGWRGVFVIKPSLLGDAGGALALLAQARAPVVFSSALETAVGAKAALRLAFAFGGERRALGFGVWPLFENECLNGPGLAPFLRARDVLAIDEEAAWNALR